MAYRKNYLQKKIDFSADCVNINEIHVVQKWRHMQSEQMK